MVRRIVLIASLVAIHSAGNPHATPKPVTSGEVFVYASRRDLG